LSHAIATYLMLEVAHHINSGRILRGDHSFEKPGNATEFNSCPEMSGENLLWRKMFIANFTFWATPVFNRLVVALFHLF